MGNCFSRTAGFLMCTRNKNAEILEVAEMFLLSVRRQHVTIFMPSKTARRCRRGRRALKYKEGGVALDHSKDGSVDNNEDLSSLGGQKEPEEFNVPRLVEQARELLRKPSVKKITPEDHDVAMEMRRYINTVMEMYRGRGLAEVNQRAADGYHNR